VIIVGIAAVNTVISLAYYLGVVKRMMFDEPGADDKPLSLPRGASSYLTLLAGLLLAVGIWWNPLLSVAIHAVSALNFPPVETLR